MKVVERDPAAKRPQRRIALDEKEGDFVPFLVRGPVDATRLDAAEQRRYEALIADTAEELGPREPYSRETRCESTDGRNLGPEDDGIMAKVVSTTVPCALPYLKELDVERQEKVYVDGKKEYRKVMVRETWALHYTVCTKCKEHIYGTFYNCNGCPRGSGTYLCSPCYMVFQPASAEERRKIHEHEYFQGYSVTEPVGMTRLVLYRNYSAIVSMPKDHLALVWAPAFPHYDKERHALANLYWEGVGIEFGSKLISYVSIGKSVPKSGVAVHSQFGVSLGRGYNAYALSFPESYAAAPLWQTVAFPLLLRHCSPADVRHCAALSRALYHAVVKSDAMARAKLLHLCYERGEERLLERFGDHWGAALQQHEACRDKYLRLVVGKCARGDDFVILDVNCGAWRSLQCCRVPDSAAADRAQAEFHKKNPGYID